MAVSKLINTQFGIKGIQFAVAWKLSGSYQPSGANLGIKVVEPKQDFLLFIGREPEISSQEEK
jgi:hypothetical protein